ncbi:hypothetical protein ACSAM2_10655 [Actinomyces oris]|uniref:hypothetical protein n=1 Tax=Actinomyces TaxID=1654 RepID=UPI0021005CB6|nr:hypothetical protein [Actinomyces oris]
MAVPALAACQDESGPARPSASSSASSSAKKSDKSAEPSEKPSKESKNSNVEYVPSWEFPHSHSGWNVTVYDVDGKNKMDKQNGCVFTATQNLYAQTTKDDQAESGYQADAVIDAYQKSSDFTNVSFEPTKDDSTLVKDTDGHAIETKRLDFTYTGADHKDYKLTRVVRVFSTVGRPVMLQGMYACPVNVYSSSEMEELFKATPISNPGPADMDEGSSSDGAGKDGNDGKKSESEDKKSDEKSSGSSPKDT